MVQQWRNIASPDNRGASRMVQSGGNQIASAFSGMGNIVEDYQTQVKADNTFDAQTGVESFTDLSKLNAADTAGQFNSGALRAKYGRLVDASQIGASVNEAKGKLRAQALNAASEAGNEAASASGDMNAGAQAVRESLMGLGVVGPKADEMTSQWLKGADVLKNSVNQSNKEQVDKIFGEQFRNIKTAEEMSAAIAQAPQQLQEGLKQKASEMFGDQAQDLGLTNAAVKKARDDKAYNQGQAVDKALGAYSAALSGDGDIEVARQKILGSLKGKELTDTTTKMRTLEDNMGKLTPRQNAELANIGQKDQLAITQMNEAYQAEVVAKKQAKANIPVGVETVVQEGFRNVKNAKDSVQKAIMKDIKLTWGGGILDQITGNNNLNKLGGVLDVFAKANPTLEKSEIAAIAYQAWDTTYLQQRDQWFAGIEFGILSKAMNDSVKNYQARKKIDIEVANLQLKNGQDNSKAQSKAIDRQYQYSERLSSGNLRGKSKVNPLDKFTLPKTKPPGPSKSDKGAAELKNVLGL